MTATGDFAGAPAGDFAAGGRLESWVQAALAAVSREYPHQLAHEMHSDADVLPPRELHPAFCGSYDFHSSVHNHWLLVRSLDLGLPPGLTDDVTALLDDHLSEPKLAGEVGYFARQPPPVTGRPYGWAWLLLLGAACAASAAGRRRGWERALAPLADMIRTRFAAYLRDQLNFPIRSGVHSNTAFSIQLALEAARACGDTAMTELLTGTADEYFGSGADICWTQPPSGDSFLSPPLAEACLMADIMDGPAFTGWLESALPAALAGQRLRALWLPPDFIPNGDPASVHLEGLLISRAWSLSAIARCLPAGHPVGDTAAGCLDAHMAAIRALDPADGFMRSHWLPTYCLYLSERLAEP